MASAKETMSTYEWVQQYILQAKNAGIPITVGDVMRAYEVWRKS